MPSEMMIRAANPLAEARPIPGMPGAYTAHPDWHWRGPHWLLLHEPWPPGRVGAASKPAGRISAGAVDDGGVMLVG